MPAHLDGEKVAFFKDFVLYGGIPRVLDFLQQHMDDIRCVNMSCKVILTFIFESFPQISAQKYAVVIAKTVVQSKNEIELYCTSSIHLWSCAHV
mmetsp:Transcript_17490/g.31563  ORF Transcript_17490/g.31563 Transcript_17490/m.31563 type:complete len:94 (-) Transcript_17490:263-544(-)